MNLAQVRLFVGILASLLTLLAFLYKFRKKILQISLVRRFIWWIKNEKIRVKINTSRRYSYFNLQIHDIEKEIKQIITNRHTRFSTPPLIGENYIVFAVEKMTAPIKFSFYPNVTEDSMIENNEQEEKELIVTANILGELLFVYREVKDYSEIISLIDEIYEKMERIYNVKPLFANNTVIATFSDNFQETWSRKKEIKEGDTVIKVGSSVVMAHSARLLQLSDIVKFLTQIRA